MIAGSGNNGVVGSQYAQGKAWVAVLKVSVHMFTCMIYSAPQPRSTEVNVLHTFHIFGRHACLYAHVQTGSLNEPGSSLHCWDYSCARPQLFTVIVIILCGLWGFELWFSTC